MPNDIFKMDYIKHSGIFVLVFVSIGMCQDETIVSNFNLDETHWNSSDENSTIPESLLIRMKDVRNVSQFLSQFVLDTPEIMHGPGAINDTDSSRRALSAAAAAANIAQPANCQTEMRVVELDKPENAATIYWPSCVRVRRCGGCCPSSMLACKPLATSVLNVTVLQMHYNHENPNTFEGQGTRIFSLVQHDRCSCTCKESAEDCDPHAHDFRPSECRCVCKNAEEAASCTGPKKVWDNRHCVCRCRKARMCSTGLYFNTLTCRCEILRRSLAVENLNLQNSNTSLSL